MVIAWCFTDLFEDVRKRFLAYMFAAFSGGIGWVVYLLTARRIRGMSDGYLKDPFNSSGTGAVRQHADATLDCASRYLAVLRLSHSRRAAETQTVTRHR